MTAIWTVCVRARAYVRVCVRVCAYTCVNECVSPQHCTLDLGSYIKDLSVVHNDLSSIVILDNSPGAYRSHPGTHTHTNSLTQRELIYI